MARPPARGTLLVGVGVEALSIFTVVWISHSFESKSETYGAIGGSLSILLWAYVLGRIIAAAPVVNAMMWRRFHPAVPPLFPPPVARVLSRPPAPPPPPDPPPARATRYGAAAARGARGSGGAAARSGAATPVTHRRTGPPVLPPTISDDDLAALRTQDGPLSP